MKKLELTKESFYEYYPIIAFVLVSVFIGLLVLGDYGESRDELNIRNYAAHTLENYYRLLLGKPAIDFSSGHLDHYGPIFFVGTSIFAQLIQRMFGEAFLNEGWHFSYFLVFELSVFFMYMLSRRFFGRWASFSTAALYGSQPLLWGHAFINPKDIPFLAFFLVAVTLGLQMVDHASGFQPLSLPHKPKSLRWYWDSTEPRIRMIALISLFLVIAWAISIPVTGRIIERLAVRWVVESLDSGSDNFFSSILGNFISYDSSNSIAYYAHRAKIYAWLIHLGVWFLSFISSVLFSARHFTKLRYWQINSVIEYLKSFISSPICVIAAIALGLSVSTRVLGFYVLGVIGLYAIYRIKENILVLVLAYLVIASIITYITWPYLWGNPILSYLSSLVKMADFPWDGDLLFDGQLIQSVNLPWYYLPKLMAFQFTEPVVLFFILGIGMSFVYLSKSNRITFFIIFLVWFLMPIGLIVALRSTLYDNFRHLIFIIPPVFLAVGVVLDWLFGKIKIFGWRAALLVIILIPSFYGLFVLHPFQYVYYNGFAGWNEGAFRKYEMDYWLTSFKEIGLYLNKNAAPESQVMVFGPTYLLRKVLREDIQIIQPNQDLEGFTVDYAVVPSRKNDDLLGCREAPVIFQVERAGAILGVVKAPESVGQCP